MARDGQIKSASHSKPRRPAGDTVAALARGIAVLRCFGEGAGTLSHGDIARQTRIPKPTVTRLVSTLEALGLLRQVAESDHYTLAAGVLPLARAYLAGLDASGLSARTQARRLSALRQFHRFLLDEGIRGDDPTAILDSPKLGRPLPKVLKIGRAHV